MTDDRIEQRVKKSEEREATSHSSLLSPHSSPGDYPLYANRSDTLTAASGRPLRDLSLQKTLTEDISSEDYSISAETCAPRPKSPATPATRNWRKTWNGLPN